MLKLVFPGSCNCDTDAIVSKSRPRTFMEEVEGFTAMGVRLCERYQANIWCPNLDVLEEAPATARRGEDMKVRAAVCIVGSVGGIAGWWVRWEDFRAGGFCGSAGLGIRDLDDDSVKVGYDVSTRAEASFRSRSSCEHSSVALRGCWPRLLYIVARAMSVIERLQKH